MSDRVLNTPLLRYIPQVICNAGLCLGDVDEAFRVSSTNLIR